MTSPDVLQTLQELEFTKDMEPRYLEELAALASEIKFGEGQTIFREADVGEFVYLIAEGQVAVEIHVPGRGRVTILTVGPGQLLGWSSLFPSAHKTASARTVTTAAATAVTARWKPPTARRWANAFSTWVWHLTTWYACSAASPATPNRSALPATCTRS